MAENDSLTITLTHQPPVRIKKSDWPIGAEARDEWHDGEVRSRANIQVDWKLTVRQHVDGRFIVYGIYKYTSQWANDRGYNVRGGEKYLAGADIPEAIGHVGAWMADQEHRGDDASRWKMLVNHCTADLPAEELV